MLLASLLLFVLDVPGMSTVAGVPSVLSPLLLLASQLLLLVVMLLVRLMVLVSF
jgi:hypothetical protein